MKKSSCQKASTTHRGMGTVKSLRVGIHFLLRNVPTLLAARHSACTRAYVYVHQMVFTWTLKTKQAKHPAHKADVAHTVGMIMKGQSGMALRSSS